jgi:hypothetical protein
MRELKGGGEEKLWPTWDSSGLRDHQSPEISDREVITDTSISDAKGFLAAARGAGDYVSTRSQSTEMDAKEDSYVQSRFEHESSEHYNAFTNNCDQFASRMAGVVGSWDNLGTWLGFPPVPNRRQFFLDDPGGK